VKAQKYLTKSQIPLKNAKHNPDGLLLNALWKEFTSMQVRASEGIKET
jgi:hypothetical protein